MEITDLEINIRYATLNDSESCANIHARSWLFAYDRCVDRNIIEEYNTRWPMIWPKMLAKNENSHYVIEVGEKIIGFLTVNPARDADLPDTVYELVALYLDPDYIGKSFGRQAMAWVKNEIISRGYNTVSLWVLEQNSRARRFYEKSGFIFEGNSKPSGLGDTVELRYICNL